MPSRGRLKSSSEDNLMKIRKEPDEIVSIVIMIPLIIIRILRFLWYWKKCLALRYNPRTMESLPRSKHCDFSPFETRLKRRVLQVSCLITLKSHPFFDTKVFTRHSKSLHPITFPGSSCGYFNCRINFGSFG